MTELVEPKPVHLPPFSAWLASNIPAVYDNTMSYYEELTSLLKWLETEVVPNVNEAIELAVTLRKYVEDYFKNLDVQEEINNKLDQMAEDGTLQEIIAQYIQSTVTWTFDTVADMKLADNLVAGSYAQTLGFHSLNDGGGATYYITNSGTADEMSIIAVGSLYANLVAFERVNVKQFGAYGDNTHDDTTSLQGAMDYSSKVVYFPEGTYLIKGDTNNAPLTDTTDASKCGLLISSEKSLIGNKAVIKTYHTDETDADIYCISTSNKLEIRGLTFNGQYSDYHHTYGVQLNASDNKIYECEFINMGGSGLVFNGSYANNIDRNNVDNCKFQNCGNSIFCAWVNDSNFSNIQFFNVSEGFDFDKKSSNVSISNILAHTYRGDGADACIEINGCSNFVITNVTCKNFIDGILINGKVIPTENLNLTTISENIAISDCTFDTINGYGVVFGNVVEDIDECVNINMDNIIVKGSNLDGFHLRGNNITLTNSIAENCARAGILINDKAKNIVIDNFINNGCYQGLINCSIADNLTLSNIYDNEVNNTSNTVSISNVADLTIDNLIVKNISEFSRSNNRLFSIGATKARLNGINMPVLDTAIFFVTASTVYTISNSVCKLRDLKIDNPTIVISDIVPSTLGNTMAFKTGTIAIVNEGVSTTNAYICVRGNMEGGSTVTWKKITTEDIS